MTASLYMTGTHAASVERGPLGQNRDEDRPVSVAHAVARPVVDGLDASVCGVLVTAIADLDWSALSGPRCEECRRIAG